MKIIVPMAGRGKRMRPHTLTVPKPLLKVAGKPIVQRLVEDLAEMCEESISEIAFIIGDFGKEVEEELLHIAKNLGAKGTIYHQGDPLGTAHAVLCAKESLEGKVIVAFADTLFKAEFSINNDRDGVIYVKQIADPSAFGVVKLSEDGYITDFIEKPTEFVSDLAIIGIYYFKDGVRLRQELQYLIDNNIRDKDEFQITNALENMKNQGIKIYPGEVKDWLDCGNKDATVDTNRAVLNYEKNKKQVAESAKIINSVIIHPCFVGEDVVLENSIIGPYVSVGDQSRIENSRLANCIIQESTRIQWKMMDNSMVGSFVELSGKADDASIGDYTTIK